MADGKYITYLERSLGLILIVFCVFPQFTSLFIVLTALLIAYGYTTKELVFRWKKIGWWMIAFYLAYLIGVFWTENEPQAFKYLEYKLALIVFPLLLSFESSKRPFNITVLFQAWIIGVTVASVVGIGNSFLCDADGGASCFVAGFISPIHHPSYFAAFHTVALGIAWWGYSKKMRGFKLWWILPFTLFSLTLHLFLLSLAGMLFLMLAIVAAVLYLIYKKWGRLAFVLATLSMPLGIFLAINYVPRLEGEFNGAKYYFDEYIKNPEAFVKGRSESMSGSEARLVMWTVTGQAIADHPFGVGTGNVEKTLETKLISLGHAVFADEKLNPHNQYLQTGLEIGWLGLLILVGIILVSIIVGIKNRNWLLILVAANLAFNCLFESMLQRQSGMVFYVFWLLILSTMDRPKSLSKHEKV